MKIAVNPKKFDNFGYQIIINEDFNAIGVNFLCDKKILMKERFKQPVRINSNEDESKLVQKIIFKLFKN